MMKIPVGFSQLYWGVVQYRLEFVVGREERGESVTHKGRSWEAKSSSGWPEALSSDVCWVMGTALPWGLRPGGAQVRALEAGAPIRPSPGLLFSPPVGSPGQKRGPGVLRGVPQGSRHNDPPPR